MWKRRLYIPGGVIFFSLLIYFVFFSYETAPRHDDSQVVAQLKWVDSANAEEDAKKAIMDGDARFLEVGGYGPYVPGVEEKDSVLIRRTGVRFLEGTSDAYLSREHMRLNDLAVKYATEYNLILLHHLRRRDSIATVRRDGQDGMSPHRTTSPDGRNNDAQK